MSFKKWLKKERTIWHRRFIPSLIAGLTVAIITFFFQLTTSNMVMFASLGASAAILTHQEIHRLSILRTVILSYFIALIISFSTLLFSQHFTLTFPLLALLAITSSTMIMYLFDVFHPPAISATLAFIMFEGDITERIIIFSSVLVLLVLVKLLTYLFYYEQLEMRQFMKEFKRIEKETSHKFNLFK